MSGSRVQLDAAPDLYQAESHTVSWWDEIGLLGWDTKLDHEKVRLSAVGAGTLTVDLGLDLLGQGCYSLGVDVLKDVPPASSAFEVAVDQKEGGDGTGEGSPSEELNTEDAGEENIEDARGQETGSDAEDRDAVAPSGSMEDGDHHDILA